MKFSLFDVKLINKKISKDLVTSTFGWRKHPFTQKLQFHNGVDISLPAGEPLYAPADCLLSWNYHQIGGLQAVLQWQQKHIKIRIGFAHCSWVNENKKIIKRGDLIARVGNTGMSTGPHLHLTVATWSRDGWVFMDPLEVLDGWV